MDTSNGPRTTARLVDAGTRLLRGLATSVALLGLLVAPPAQALVLAPTAAAVAFVSTAALGWYLTACWPRPRVPARIAAVVGGAVPFAYGLDLLGPAGRGVGVALLVLGSACLLGHLARTDAAPADATPGPAPAPHPVAAPDGSWLDLVQVLPMSMLLAEWRSVDQRLRLEPDAPPGLEQLRELLQQELHRRDPAAVALSWQPEPADTSDEAPGDDDLRV